MNFLKNRYLLTYLLILISFGCSNFNLQQSGSIAINFPETESKTISRTAPTQEESDNRKVTTYLVILSSNKIGNIEKEVGPGEKIEFTDLPEGEYSIYCVAKIVDTPHFGDEANVTVTSGQTSTVELQLKPVVSIDFLDSDGEAYTGEMAWLGRTIIIPKPNISKIPEGYTLEYWTTIVDGEVKNYYPGESFTLTSVEAVLSFSMKLKRIGVTQVGHIAYDDMTTSKNYNSSKTAIGIVIEVDEETGLATKIMSLKENSSVKWFNGGQAIYSCSSISDDGSIIREEFNDFDDFAKTALKALLYAVSLTEGYLKWYIPAKNELKLIYDNKEVLNDSLKNVQDSVLIGNSVYWSSTIEDSKVWVLNFYTNDSNEYGKYSNYEAAARGIAKFAEETY